jgi:hypothetical protein
MIEMTEEEFKWWLDNRFKAGYDAGFAIAQVDGWNEEDYDGLDDGEYFDDEDVDA